MKNYKSILFIAASIITTSNNHITQTNDNFMVSFINQLSRFFEQSEYEDQLNQLRNDLRGIPPEDIDAIEFRARRNLNTKNPKKDSRINQIMRRAIVDQIRDITATAAKNYTNNQEEIDASVRSMVNNVEVRLKKGKNLNGLALTQFFNRNLLKRLILQNVKNPHCDSSQTYATKPSTYLTKPANQTFAPKRPSRLHAYDEYLEQFKHDLKGIPVSDINAIAAIGRQELIRQRPTNDNKKNNIMHEAIINRVRINTHTYASSLTKDQSAIDNTVDSMNGNVKARLARGDNLNGEALEQFFGSNLEDMIQQNISRTQKTQTFRPEPSAPEIPEQENFNECCVCFESSALKNIPCPNGGQHSDQICPICISQIIECPICRSKLRK